MATITNLVHEVSGFKLAGYWPDNSHSVDLYWRTDGVTINTTLFFKSAAEALPVVRALATPETTITLGIDPHNTRRENLLAWLAAQDAAAEIEAERERAAEEELELERAQEELDGGSWEGNGDNSYDGVSDDGN